MADNVVPDPTLPRFHARARAEQEQLEPEAAEENETRLRTLQTQAAFLEEFALGGIVLRAAQKAGVDRRTIYRWREKDPHFRELYDEAMEDAMDRLESAARKRAEFGVERPVYQHGAEVGTVTEYSDNLTMFLLKGRRPEVFKERSEVDQRVRAEVIDPLRSTDEELEARILAAAEEIRVRRAKLIGP